MEKSEIEALIAEAVGKAVSDITAKLNDVVETNNNAISEVVEISTRIEQAQSSLDAQMATVTADLAQIIDTPVNDRDAHVIDWVEVVLNKYHQGEKPNA